MVDFQRIYQREGLMKKEPAYLAKAAKYFPKMIFSKMLFT